MTLWALIVEGEVSLIRDEAPRRVVTTDATGVEPVEVELTDEQLGERGWVQVVEVERPSDTHVVEIEQVEDVWTQVWAVDPDLVP